MAKQRLDLKQAAEALGTTVDAVRQRIRRGTLESDKGDDGRVYVWLNLDQTVSQGDSYQALLEAKDETIASQNEQIRFLRAELERKDHLLAAALERAPAIEAPTEPRGSPAEASSESGEDTERPSWWRRVFGG